jgi:aminopeptidase N
MEYVLVGLVVVVVVLAFTPPGRRLLGSIGLYLGAQADTAAESVANADPLGVYKSQIANAVEKGKNASNVVGNAAKQLESLQRQINDDIKEQTRLSNRLEAVLANGDPNNTAERYALDLERVESNLARNQEQLAVAQEVYTENLSLVERYEREVSSARRDAEEIGLQLERSAAERDLSEMSAALHDQLNLGDLSQTRRRVQEQIDANRGASRAARDLSRQGTAEDADEELERQQRAQEVLNRFRSK